MALDYRTFFKELNALRSEAKSHCRGTGRGENPTVSIRDLIALKRHAGRKQDLVGVERLRTILES